MPKINVISKKSAWKRLKEYLKLGLSASAIYGLVWAAPRVINQYNLNSNEQEVSELIKNLEDEKAMQRIGELERKSFLIPSKGREVCEGLKRKIKDREIAYLELSIFTKAHSSAYSWLSGQRNRDLFTENELSELETKIQKIHPDTLIKKADSEDSSLVRIDLYEAAEKELKRLNGSRPELKERLVHSYIKNLQEVYEEKDADKALAKMNDLVHYITAEKPDLKNKDLSVFFGASKRFLSGVLLPNDKDYFMVRRYLVELNLIAESLNLEDRPEIMADFANRVMDYVAYDPNSKKYYHGSNALSILENILSIAKDYNPEKLKEAIDLCLLSEEIVEYNQNLSGKFLDIASRNVNSLPKKAKNELQIKIAGAYLEKAKKIGKKDSYPLILMASGLYHEAGVPADDKRFSELEKISQKMTEE